jgi:hypothetical protein
MFTILGVLFLVLGIGLAAVALLPGEGSVMDAVRVEGMGIAAITLIPMGIIFTAIGVYFGRLTAGRRRLLREGIPGLATILSLEGGSMVVNNINYLISFRLRVTLPGRAPYDVDHRQLVPIFALGSLPIGASVPVMVDAKDPQKLTIDLAGEAAGLRQVGPRPATGPAGVVPNTLSTMQGSAPNTFTTDQQPPDATWPTAAAWSISPGSQVAIGAPIPPVGGDAAIGGITGATLGMVLDQLARSGVSIDPAVLSTGTMAADQSTALDASPTGQAAHTALLADGAPGTASIRQSRDTGIAVHGDPVVELTLDVTPLDGTAYEVRTAALVPAAARARAVAGATVPVRIDQAAPDRVAIDWGR